MELDIKKLRDALKDYYGTAMFNASPIAVIELGKVERASDQEIIHMAQKQGFDLRDYVCE